MSTIRVSDEEMHAIATGPSRAALQQQIGVSGDASESLGRTRDWLGSTRTNEMRDVYAKPLVHYRPASACGGQTSNIDEVTCVECLRALARKAIAK